jgi:hypothetical protein
MNLKPAQLSPAQYLEWEMKSSVKHEYVDGEVYAMSGASRRHNLIVGNLLRRALNAAAEHGGCQVLVVGAVRLAAAVLRLADGARSSHSDAFFLPAAAQRFHQQHACVHAAQLNGHIRELRL